MRPKKVRATAVILFLNLTKTDVSTILALIHELASFENATSSVHATETSLHSTLSFPDASSPTGFTPGFARTLLLIAPWEGGADSIPPEKEQVAGMALYFTNYSTWRGAPGVYLEDLFVRPQYRRRRYANKLLQRLALETQKIGGQRLEWACLRWNEGALKFYGDIGAGRMDEWVTLRMEGENLQKLAAGEERVAPS
jgi:GNAT superfamily N-acetyltransferase